MLDLEPRHLDVVKAILAAHVPSCEVRAFGSRVTDSARKHSDLDLAIIGPGPLDFKTMGDLREAFQESDLPMRVDLVDWHSVSTAIFAPA